LQARLKQQLERKDIEMRIVIVGSGGTGGYFGAKLARAGEDVTFVARGEHLAAIQAGGLCVRSAVDGEWTVKVRAVDTLAGHEPVDIILFCVKSFDTESAGELVRPVIGPRTGILSLQNGVDNEDKLGQLFGPEPVMGGVAYVFSNIAAPGIITHHQLARIVFGEMDGKPSERSTRFAEACQHASIQGELVPNIRKTLWEKYVFLTALAGATAMARSPVKVIREIPETRRLWELQVEELLALAEADRVGLDADMKTRCVKFLESLAPANYSSLYQDLVQGKRLELDALHGHAVRLGDRHGIPTPTLFAVYAALRPHMLGASPREACSWRASR
jgi:2-dehydropantoate 2-reductase